jgi:16S rRNA U1498 N3-methylase RsmE
MKQKNFDEKHEDLHSVVNRGMEQCEKYLMTLMETL